MGTNTRPGEAVEHPAPPISRGRLVWVLTAISLAPFSISLLTSAVLPLLTTLPRTTGLSVGTVNLVVSVTILAGTVATPVLGRLADVVGKRPVYLVSLSLVVVGCVLSAATDNFVVLLLGRLLQGPGLAIVPVSMAVVADLVPPRQLRFAISYITVALAIGAVGGLVVGGAIAQLSDDPSLLFWVLTAVSASALAAAWWQVPRSPGIAGGRVDLIGAGLLMVGLGGLLLTLSQGSSWGWSSPAILGCAAAGLAGIAGWVVSAYRLPDPLVDMPAFLSRQMTSLNVSGVCVGATNYALLLAVLAIAAADPATAGYGLGLGLLAGSALLIPGMLAQGATATLVGVIARRSGPFAPTVVGHLVILSGLVLIICWHDSAWALVVGSTVGISGYGLVLPSYPAIIVSIVEPSRWGVANGMNFIVRAVGQTVGATGTGVVVTVATAASVTAIAPLWSYQAALAVCGLGLAVSIPLLLIRPAARAS